MNDVSQGVEVHYDIDSARNLLSRSRVPETAVREAQSELQNYMADHNLKSVDGLCEIATFALRKSLSEQGLESAIVEGDVLLGSNVYMIHRVNLIKYADSWIIVDLTVGQFAGREGCEALILKCAPNNQSARAALQSVFSWV